MDVDRFSLALSEPLATATGTIDRREGFLVTIERDGIVGVGEATPLPGWTESLEACGTALRAVAEGNRDPSALDPETTPAASHAVDLSRADLAARERDVGLAELLADDPAASVPVNATVGDADPAATRRAARAAVDAGYPCLKLKVGARSVDADLDRIRAVSEAVEGVSLRVDANATWSCPDAAMAIDELAEMGVSLLEQPLDATDLAGHADLRGRGVDIALDESVSKVDADAIFDANAADVIVLKPMVTGGVRRAHEIALRARQRGVEPVVTTTIDGVVARTAALHLAASLRIDRACGLATADLLAEDLAADPAPVVDGRMAVPAASGIGVRPGDLTV